VKLIIFSIASRQSPSLNALFRQVSAYAWGISLCEPSSASHRRSSFAISITGSAGAGDVFVRGVLCTLLALVMDPQLLLTGVRAEEKVTLPFGLPLCYTKSMKKARTVKQKVIMGRPRTGITPLMGFRADPATRGAIVKWAENQPDNPTLSEAIRRLVEIGLKARK
jgi:hypothetical protein